MSHVVLSERGVLSAGRTRCSAVRVFRRTSSVCKAGVSSCSPFISFASPSPLISPAWSSFIFSPTSVKFHSFFRAVSCLLFRALRAGSLPSGRDRRRRPKKKKSWQKLQFDFPDSAWWMLAGFIWSARRISTMSPRQTAFDQLDVNADSSLRLLMIFSVSLHLSLFLLFARLFFSHAFSPSVRHGTVWLQWWKTRRSCGRKTNHLHLYEPTYSLQTGRIRPHSFNNEEPDV